MELKNKESGERRRAKRITITLPVIYYITTPFRKKIRIRGRTKDISKTGVGIVASNKPSSTLTIQIELPQEEKDKEKKLAVKKRKKMVEVINAKVKVVYSRPISDEDRDIISTGLCFVKLNKESATLLRKLLAQYNNV